MFLRQLFVCLRSGGFFSIYISVQYRVICLIANTNPPSFSQWITQTSHTHHTNWTTHKRIFRENPSTCANTMMATKWIRTTSTSTSTPSNHHHHRHTRWLFVVLALVVLLNAAANAIVPVAGSPSVRSASKSVVGSAVTDGDSPKSGDSTDSNAPGVERFYFEHKIGDKEAAAAFNTLADELINSACDSRHWWLWDVVAHYFVCPSLSVCVCFRRTNAGLVPGMQSDHRHVLSGSTDVARSLLLRFEPCARYSNCKHSIFELMFEPNEYYRKWKVGESTQKTSVTICLAHTKQGHLQSSFVHVVLLSKVALEKRTQRSVLTISETIRSESIGNVVFWICFWNAFHVWSSVPIVETILCSQYSQLMWRDLPDFLFSSQCFISSQTVLTRCERMITHIT